jgi:hypothetical protein
MTLGSRDGSIGIATGYVPDGRDSGHSIQAGCGPHPASYPMDTGASSPEVKRPGSDADHSSPSSAEVKNGGAIPPLLHTSS